MVMNSIFDKKSQICAIYFMPLSKARVEDYPGSSYITFIRGIWTRINFSKADFKEKQSGNGELIEQTFEATITNTDSDNEAILQAVVSELGFLRIDYTNGGIKVAGTDKFPVLLEKDRSGSPAIFKLSFKRQSPEFAKYFKSF